MPKKTKSRKTAKPAANKPARKTAPLLEATDAVAAALAGFDFGVSPDDFILYELSRLIEEERASFEEPEFRTLLDEGIRAHIEENLPLRARLAGVLRAAAFTGQTLTVALRVVHAIEDMKSDLCNVAVLVRSYTAYLLSRLEALEPPAEDDRLVTAADLLFESTGDRDAAQTALAVLCSERSAIAARVLAHAVSEPLLDEDLEGKAYDALKALWPLPRRYMYYNLQGHLHEDIPLRWFQLFVEMEDLASADLVLEELRAHGDHPDYREDLAALLALLHNCHDPELEDKILGALNETASGPVGMELMRVFLEEHQPDLPSRPTPWTLRERSLEKNERYLSAAALLERGETAQALDSLEAILQADPAYPFAVTLKGLVAGVKPS